MKTVQFDSTLGGLSVNIACGFAQQGSYTITAWKGKNSTIIGRGNFFDPSDDLFSLPGNPADYDGQVIQCVATIGLIPPIRNYSALMEVMQNGARIGFDIAAGESTDPAVTRPIFLTLKAGN